MLWILILETCGLIHIRQHPKITSSHRIVLILALRHRIINSTLTTFVICRYVYTLLLLVNVSLVTKLVTLQSIERIQHDDIRKRILAMTKKPCLDEEDKVCLLQIFSLLTNLEAMSQEQNMSVDDACPVYAVSEFIANHTTHFLLILTAFFFLGES